MFGLQTLDVILGPVFVYLLLSLVATALSEMVAQWLNWRAETLRQGIHGMLSRTEKSPKDIAAAREELAKAQEALDVAINKLKTGAPIDYSAYEVALTPLSGVRDALAKAARAENAARLDHERAEAAVTEAGRDGADAATLALLRTRADSTHATLDGAVKASEAAANAVASAQAGVESAFETLRKTRQADADQLREAESALVTAQSAELVARLYDHQWCVALARCAGLFLLVGRTDCRPTSPHGHLVPRCWTWSRPAPLRAARPWSGSAPPPRSSRTRPAVHC